MYTIDDLNYLMARLRDPNTGCPWDLKQTLVSINDSTIEEAYELVDALQESYKRTGQADQHVKEELGDLLFQVIFYSQLAKEDGSFSFADVVDVLCVKLIRRHPHVFPNRDLHAVFDESISEEEVKRQWEAIKAEERAEKAESNNQQVGFFDDVPKALPALKRAGKIQKRASNIGFDWPDALSALTKVEEELAELKEALEEGQMQSAEEELGDLLFSCVNVARLMKQDAENLAETANQKFMRRFEFVEQALLANGSSLERASLAQMDELWEQANLNL